LDDDEASNDAAAEEEVARHAVLFKHNNRTKALHLRSLDDDDVSLRTIIDLCTKYSYKYCRGQQRDFKLS
jgi:hypothetical protein